MRYNSIPESLRQDDSFWEPCLNNTNDIHSLFCRTGRIAKADLYDGYSVELFVDKFNDQNST